jgi:hypothetical protein
MELSKYLFSTLCYRVLYFIFLSPCTYSLYCTLYTTFQFIVHHVVIVSFYPLYSTWYVIHTDYFYLLYILDIPPIRFVFQVTQKDLRQPLMMAGYCRNMWEPIHRINEWYKSVHVVGSPPPTNTHCYNLSVHQRIT